MALKESLTSGELTLLSRLEKVGANAAQRLRRRGIKNFPFAFWLCLVFYAELAGFGVEFARQDHYSVSYSGQTSAGHRVVAGSGFYLMGFSYPVAKASAESMKVSHLC